MHGCVDAGMHGCTDAGLHGCMNGWMTTAREPLTAEMPATKPCEASVAHLRLAVTTSSSRPRHLHLWRYKPRQHEVINTAVPLAAPPPKLRRRTCTRLHHDGYRSLSLDISAGAVNKSPRDFRYDSPHSVSTSRPSFASRCLSAFMVALGPCIKCQGDVTTWPPTCYFVLSWVVACLPGIMYQFCETLALGIDTRHNVDRPNHRYSKSLSCI